MTEDYLPNKKQNQDLMTPAKEIISFENPIVGFGFFTETDEIYFIFSDGSKSEIKTTTELNKFTEKSFPKETKISRLLIHHKD